MRWEGARRVKETLVYFNFMVVSFGRQRSKEAGSVLIRKDVMAVGRIFISDAWIKM